MLELSRLMTARVGLGPTGNVLEPSLVHVEISDTVPEPKLVAKTSPPSGFNVSEVGLCPTSSNVSKASCMSEGSWVARQEPGAAASETPMIWCPPEHATNALPPPAESVCTAISVATGQPL